VEDTVFVGSCAGIFYAFNKATGEVLWSYNIRQDGKQISFHGNPLVVDDMILIGTDHSCVPDGVGHVYAFDIKTGKVRWKYKTTSVPTDIVRIGQNVYFGSFQDTWYALRLQTGELVWKFSTGASNDNCYFVRSPVADQTHLYLTGLDGFVYSLDAMSGRILWKRKLRALPSTALALKDKMLFVGANDNRIYRLNAETGNIVAELSVEALPLGRITVTANGLMALLENSSERSGYVVSLTTDLKPIWQQKFSPEWASERPYLWGKSVLVGNCRGELTALSAFDGTSQWKLKLKGCIRSIGNAGNTVFIGVQEGTIYRYDLPPSQ
jgi:eukaryotic-like serine/threonine-protein kinase